MVIDNVINTLPSSFALKDLISLYLFLGTEAFLSTDGLHYHNIDIFIILLDRANMQEVEPIPNPMASSIHLTSSGEAFLDPTKYGNVVGALQYLAITRPTYHML